MEVDEDGEIHDLYVFKTYSFHFFKCFIIIDIKKVQQNFIQIFGYYKIFFPNLFNFGNEHHGILLYMYIIIKSFFCHDKIFLFKNTNQVLDVFTNNQLDNIKTVAASDDTFFAKYLTSEKVRIIVKDISFDFLVCFWFIVIRITIK
jgi:hypothetical protein